MKDEEKQALELQLNEVAQLLYQQHERVFTPNPPWVMVRVLPRRQQVGLLVLPDDKNKPVHEGIVLKTWEPFQYGKYNFSLMPGGWPEHGHHSICPKASGAEPLVIDGLDVAPCICQSIEVRSELSPGDHVLFPHWSGLPVPGYDESKYRIVKECQWKQSEEGGIFAKVEYVDKEDKVEAYLARFSSVWHRIQFDELANKLRERFILIDKEQASVTISASQQQQ